MFSFINRLGNACKPEYVFRPHQLWLRVLRRARGPVQTVQLPWGLPLQIRLDDIIGRQIWTMGVFELPESEVLWRLAGPGEIAVDVGANIGYTASILATRVGPKGTELGFEPHPEVYNAAVANAESWTGHGVAPVRLAPLAVSDRRGQCQLVVPDAFAGNRGLSSLSANGLGGQTVSVESITLDEIVGASSKVGVLKIDVEGHELAVLAGGTETFSRKGVRDVVFEEHHGYPSRATAALENLGYAVFRIDYSWWGPLLVDGHAPRRARVFDTPNYLATFDPNRARSRMHPRGWQCLHSTKSNGRPAKR